MEKPSLAQHNFELAYTIVYTTQSFRVAEPHKNFLQLSAATSAEDAARILRPAYAELDSDKEHFVLLALNNKNRVVGFKLISTGSLTASLVHPREVFTAALYLHAAAIIVCHNHPSGDPAPSPEDIDITKRLKESADMLGIRFLDHVVLGEDRFFSFSDKGLI